MRKIKENVSVQSADMEWDTAEMYRQISAPTERVGGRLRARKEERWRMRFDMHTTYAHEHWQSQAHSHTVRARDGRIVGRYYRHCPGLERSMLPMTCDNLDGA